MRTPEAKPAATAVKPAPTNEQTVLIRNQKLVSNMRAFRKAPPELKSLVATLLTSEEMSALGKLNLRALPSYSVLRSNLKATGLTAIDDALMRAKGAKFKAALTILVDTLVRDGAVPLNLRQKLISQLTGISLMPYRFGDRHQFVAYIALMDLLEPAQLSQVSSLFERAHKTGKANKQQLFFYTAALNELSPRNAPSGRATTAPDRNNALSMNDGWHDFTMNTTAALSVKGGTGAPMRTYDGEFPNVPELPEEQGGGPGSPGTPPADESPEAPEVPELPAEPGTRIPTVPVISAIERIMIAACRQYGGSYCDILYSLE